MTDFTFPPALLAQHVAVLGKTGAGKTSTAKLAIEQVVPSGARVCVLDPIKSDWWGLTSSADGKRPGLPFHILGGPRGHLPLHERAGKAIGELVATGALPLSIIDMADFLPGGQAQFFVDFAPTLLKRMHGVVYLVLEEAHLFAPKERSGVGQENMAIHWAKMLATAGRSKGIRLVVATQRTQALHNALLGSCDTLITHRLTAPADQAPVVNWLKANVDAATRDRVASSLSSLKTGQGWICSGEAKVFELVQFPRIRTFDNTATPTGNAAPQTVKTAAVDVEALRAAIGDAVKDVEENDPKLLRKRIAELERQVASRASAKAAPASSQVEDALRNELRLVTQRCDALELVLNGWHDRARKVAKTLLEAAGDVALGTKPDKLAAAVVRHDVRLDAVVPAPRPREAARAPSPLSAGVTAPQQRILDSLAALAAFGVAQPPKETLAAHAGVPHTSGGYRNNLSALRTAGLIDYPTPGAAALTDAGRAKANAPERAPTLRELHQAWLQIVTRPQAVLLELLIDAYPAALDKTVLAQRAGVPASSGGYRNNLSHLRTMRAIDYPAAGSARAADILFPKGK
jgi:hypothetical protein